MMKLRFISTVLFLGAIFFSIAARNRDLKIERLSIEHGLSHCYVECIYQDSRGFLWIGTRDGLNRYDGTLFKIYSHDPTDSTSISDDWILSIYEDRSHTLWIGTHNGLNKLDRYTETFTRYCSNPQDSTSLSANLIREIYEDRTGNLWIAAWADAKAATGGLHKFNRENGTFKRFQHEPNNPNSLSDNAVWFIIEDDSGNLWIGTQNDGLNRFNPQTEQFTCFRHNPHNRNSLSHDGVRYGLKDRSGHLWFSTYGGGLNEFDPQTNIFIRYRHDPKNPNSLYQNNVEKIYQDSDGNIWICNGLLSRLDPRTKTFTHFRFSKHHESMVSSDTPKDILEDHSKNLWVATAGGGIVKIDLKPPKFVHYTHDHENPNSLSDNDIRLIFEDRDGILWIGTRETGLTRFDPNNEIFTHFQNNIHDPTSLSHNIVYSIFQDHLGTIWIGTLWGLNRLEQSNNSFSRYLTDSDQPENLTESSIIAINEDRSGVLWVGSYGGGLYRFNPKTDTFTQYKVDPEAKTIDRINDIRSIHEDRTGNFWVGTWTNLYLFDRQTGNFRLFPAFDNDDSNFGLTIFEDNQGNIWGGNLGLNRVDLQQKQFQRFRIRPNEKRELGFDLTYNHIECIYETKEGLLWCGTRNGLHLFDPLKEKFIAHCDEKDGLPSGFILKIIDDNQSNLWLLTGRGISILNQDKKIHTFDIQEGVVNTPTAPNAFIKTISREIYWGGTNGIYRFFPDRSSTNPCIPSIMLTDLTINNKPASLDTTITEIQQIKLKHNENFFTIRFAALDFTRPTTNQYAYQLEGLDKDWIFAGTTYDAHYTHVPPGKYIFHVKGSNNEGLWNESGTTVKIVISPPYWKSWWFRTLIIAILGLILYAFHRYRLGRRKEIQRTRNRIARDLHDDLSSSLSSIALTSELLQNEYLNEHEKKSLERIKQTSRRLIEAMDDIVWAVNPEYDKLDNLLLRMKDYAAEIFTKSQINYLIRFPEQEFLQACRMDFRRNLFLIYKEILHNIVKHANASQVKIELVKLNSIIELTITDDGCGFDPKFVSQRNGLKNMQMRSKEIDGLLEIKSQVKQGTKVCLTVKIP